MILDMPSGKYPAESQFSLNSLSGMKENTFNAKVEVYEGDEYWAGEVSYKNLNEAQTREHRVFYNKCRGTAGEFWFIDYTHKQLGDWGGSIKVDGANQDGILLNVKDATPNVLVAPAGDRFQLGDHLFELTEDIYADGAGKAQLRFLPDIRVIPDNNALIISNNPKSKCMLQPKQTAPQATTKRALLTDFKYKIRESLR